MGRVVPAGIIVPGGIDAPLGTEKLLFKVVPPEILGPGGLEKTTVCPGVLKTTFPAPTVVPLDAGRKPDPDSFTTTSVTAPFWTTG